MKRQNVESGLIELRLLEKAANAGDERAQLYLARMYTKKGADKTIQFAGVFSESEKDDVVAYGWWYQADQNSYFR